MEVIFTVFSVLVISAPALYLVRTIYKYDREVFDLVAKPFRKLAKKAR